MHPESKLVETFRILSPQQKALKKIWVETVKDLLYHFPTRYGNTAEVTSTKDLKKGDTAVVFGTISGLKTSKAFRKKIPMAEGFVTDATGKIKIIWFHQAYLAKMISEGTNVRVEGIYSPKVASTLSTPSIPKRVASRLTGFITRFKSF